MDFQQGLVKPAGKVWFAFAVDPIHSAAVLQGKELIFGEVRNVFPDQAQSLRFAVTVIQRQAEAALSEKPGSWDSAGVGLSAARPLQNRRTISPFQYLRAAAFPGSRYHQAL